MEFNDSDLRLTCTDMTGVETREYKGEHATAVRDYFEMLFYYGVKEDPRG